jgi:uncharacterized protein (TIGR03437 family)
MGTAVDLVRIWSRLDPSRPGSLVSASGFQELIRRPSPPVSVGTAAYYGLGFNVRPVGGSATLWHFGGLPGTRSYAARFASGVTFAVLFNFRPNLDQGQDQAFEDEFEAAYNNFLTRSRTWPAHDYFPLYYTGERARVVDNGIVSAASFKAGAVSPGQILTLFGLHLGPKELITARIEGGNRLANNLAGTRVLFDGTPAPLVYVSETQLSAIVPYNVAGKSRVRVEVERLGVPSAAQELSIAEAAPALFTANASGVGPAAATVYPTERIAVLYATGEGLVNPLPPDGALATTQPLPAPRLPVRVLLGKGSEAREAEVLYAGAAPGLTAGLLQINIKYPEGTPSGIAVTLQVGTAQSPDGVTLEIP